MDMTEMNQRGRVMTAAQTKRFGEYVIKQQEYLKIVYKIKDIQKKLLVETNEVQRALLVKYFNNNLKKMKKAQVELGMENEKAEEEVLLQNVIK